MTQLQKVYVHIRVSTERAIANNEREGQNNNNIICAKWHSSVNQCVWPWLNWNCEKFAHSWMALSCCSLIGPYLFVVHLKTAESPAIAIAVAVLGLFAEAGPAWECGKMAAKFFTWWVAQTLFLVLKVYEQSGNFAAFNLFQDFELCPFHGCFWSAHQDG